MKKMQANHFQGVWALVAIALGLLFVATQAKADCDGSNWTGSRTLDAAAEFTLDYKIDVNNKLVIRLKAKTTGWVGFGLSEAGHMLGADIVTAAVLDGGVARIEDRFTAWEAFPLDGVPPAKDHCQHWTTVCAFEDQSFTEVILTRPLVTNDTQDRDILENKDMHVIFAYGLTDEVVYHGARRGNTMVNFYSATSAVFTPPADVTSTVDLLMANFALTSTRTQYVLQKFVMPTTLQHVVAAEPIIQDADKPYAHHILLHDCGPDDIYPFSLLPTGFAYLPSPPISPLGQGPCQGLVYGWAVGGGAAVYPNGTGVRVGTGAARILILEFHLDNPRGDTGPIITSGVRLHFAPLRTYDLGTLILGNAGADMPTMPKGQAKVHRESTCPSQCTSTYSGPIQLVQSFPHMHSYGREIWTEKNDSATATTSFISHKQFWNFGFQTTFQMNVTVNPNDILSTHCVYDTTKAESDVSFGTSSSQEMCMDFIMYYPKQNAGAKCGWSAGDKTECKTSVMNPVIPNPIPDGDTTIPPSVSVGAIPGTCLLDLGVTFNPTASPTVSTSAPSATLGGKGAAASLQAMGSVVTMIVCLVGALFAFVA